MVAFNPPGQSAYGPLQANDGSLIVSDESGVDVLGPVLTANGAVIQNLINAATGQNITGVPVLNALLIELRVLNNILLFQQGSTSLDLEQMRADEAYNISLLSGAQTL